MPYANNNGVKIYYEVEGEGAPLVLAHGASRKLDQWRWHGYDDALRHDFTLILFDARGHGRSDKPHETSAYTPKLMVDDVVAVLDNLGISKSHYFGYSMGAGVGFRAAIRSASRFHSFIYGGQSPYRREATHMAAAVERYKLISTDPEAYLQQEEQALGHPLKPEMRDALLANDGDALVILLRAFFDWPPLTNDELSRISVPCLLFCGDLDPNYAMASESVSHMPHATFVALPGLNHGTAFDRSDLVLPQIKRFLAGVSKQGAG